MQGGQPFSVAFYSGGCARAHPPGVAPEASEEWLPCIWDSVIIGVEVGRTRAFSEVCLGVAVYICYLVDDAR